jgi:RNA polymerase sigma-70 factor (ECF subfamily)
MSSKLSHKTDTELFDSLRASHGEAERAFAELYHRYAQKLYLYCRKVLGNENEAHDVFQETWMRFHTAAKKGVEVDNVGGYIFRIARNLCLNRRRTTTTFVEIEHMTIAVHDRPYEQKELLSLVDRALDVLDIEYREAFVLHAMEGMTYDEIAAITGDTVPALKNRVWRARKQIRKLLSPFMTEM